MAKKSFKDEFQKSKEQLTPRTKDGLTTGDVVKRTIIKAWSVLVILPLVGGISFFMVSQQTSKYNDLEKLYHQYTEAEVTLKHDLNMLEKESKKEPDEVKKSVDVVLNSARDAGARLVEIENQLATYGIGGQPYDVNDRKETVEKLKAFVKDKNWQDASFKRHPDWELSFKSIADYEGDIIPVVFTMTYKDKLMGIVTAEYRVGSDSFSEIVVHYTVEGNAPENTVEYGGA